ncbi:MAG TPA: hypothetical protein VJN18_03170 [Polyangiaceae bacterium]|nr:hypothetical protein [Polyangiaceae bacterium]
MRPSLQKERYGAFALDTRVAALLKLVRVDVPPTLSAVYATFESLMVEVLLRDEGDLLGLVERLTTELACPVTAACVRRWVMKFEFEWLLAGAVYHGAKAVDSPTLAWSATTQSNEWLARVAVLRVLHWRESLLANGPTAPQRRRGRPAKPEIGGQVELILRERLYAAGRSMHRAALQSAPHLPTPWAGENFYKRVKETASREVPVPSTWRTSEWCQRIAPLRDIDFLKISQKRKQDAAAIRASR